jgi:hypothetical protein
MSKYNLSLTKKQAQVIEKALEIMTRMGIGQIDSAVDLCYLFNMKDPKKVRSLCNELKKELTGFESNTSWGIHNKEVSDDYRIAFDIRQVIQHQIFNDEPKDIKQKFKYSLSAYPAHKTSTTEELPSISITERIK